MYIKINKKKCPIRFGASVLIRLGRQLGKETLQEVLDEISKIDFEKLSLDSIELLSKIIIAGLANADGNSKRIAPQDIEDMLFDENQQEEITTALNEFVNSINEMVESKGGEDEPKKK